MQSAQAWPSPTKTAIYVLKRCSSSVFNLCNVQRVPLRIVGSWWPTLDLKSVNPSFKMLNWRFRRLYSLVSSWQSAPWCFQLIQRRSLSSRSLRWWVLSSSLLMTLFKDLKLQPLHKKNLTSRLRIRLKRSSLKKQFIELVSYSKCASDSWALWLSETLCPKVMVN